MALESERMPCNSCLDLVDITDFSLPYTVTTCGCGREIKLRRTGKNGIGFRIEKGDQLVISSEALRIAVNPLRGSGEFSPSGISWFAEQVFGASLATMRARENMGEVVQGLIDTQEHKLKQSLLLNDIDFDEDNAGELIAAIVDKDPKSIEWWDFSSSVLYSIAADAIKDGKAAETAWAIAVAERFRVIALFREHFEEVVLMGNSARKLVELLEVWDANRDNGNEEFWQATLASHSYAISQLFAVPVSLIKTKAYVGGQTLEHSDARLLDFMLSGTVSSDAIFLEIKTPVTTLLGKKYRKNAFPPSSDLGGSVVQVSDYFHTFRENLLHLTKNGQPQLTAFNSKLVVLIGNYQAELTDSKKRSSFELFRGALRGIEIVTFDEFFRKVENLAKLFNLVRRNPNNS